MAETNDAQNQQSQTNVISPEVANQMSQSLGMFGGKVPDNKPEAKPENTDTKSDATNSQQQIEPFTFEKFNEKYKWSSPEDAYKEIDELRTIKQKYETEEISFENDDSEKLYNAILKGDRKQVLKILDKQERLDSYSGLEITKDNAADIIKFGMALKFEDLSPSEIDYKYNKEFGLPKEPKEPVQKSGESDDDFLNRHDQWKELHGEWKESVKDAEMRRLIEAKTLRPTLEADKKSLNLPEIKQEVDEDYLKWKEGRNQQQTANEDIVTQYKSITPEAIKINVPFKDEANKVDYNFQYVPDTEEFQQAMDMIADFSKFFGHFKKEDGSGDRESFMQALIFGLNRNKILGEALKQATNGTIKSKLPDNTKGGLVRHLVTNEDQQKPNELDQLMQQSLRPWQPRTASK